ncbi:hypothetical protein OCOJLMKI_1980 [Methylobacterium iners]|uniref:Uncharacterized protein n=1 Tax=Methylobacterium iners TaxID=418707 RepID=A0ABQ4RVB3_9HYPH|nr:hypothetical protein OCOJLMKI_1980 [Methylobacterium iners]
MGATKDLLCLLGMTNDQSFGGLHTRLSVSAVRSLDARVSGRGHHLTPINEPPYAAAATGMGASMARR